jgi:polar amino acid transport system substrate-binding protein
MFEFRSFCVVGVLLTLALKPAAAGVCDEPLVQGWQPWPPYQIPSEGDPKGIDIEIVQAIAAEMGCEVDYRQMPWTRLLNSIERGDVDFAVQANYSPDRAAFAYYSDTYLPYVTTLIVPKGAPASYENLEAFLEAGNRLGIMQGYRYSEEVDALLEDPRYAGQVFEGYNLDAHMEPLMRGRLDGVIAEKYVFLHEARAAEALDSVTVTDVTVSRAPTYGIFSKESTSPSLVKAFNAAMATVRERGTFDRIRAHYLPR